MRSLELQPTYENIRDAFINDSIGRNEGIFHYINLLNSVENSFSLAIDSYWGSGKTFFVKQLKLVLDANNSFVDNSLEEDREKILEVWKMYNSLNIDVQPQVTVYYDAWENDNDNDPILSLVYCILQSINNVVEFEDKDRLNKVFEFAANIFDFITNKNISSALEKIKEINKHENLESILSGKDLHQSVSEFLESILPERGNRLVIFVDELDRCKPDFAVKLLERIKHYFCLQNITFVFSVNIEELQHTIKNFYGNGFDASRYLDRFFDLRLPLPKADMNKFYQSINVIKTDSSFDFFSFAVINYFDFELREITRYYSDIKLNVYELYNKYKNYNNLDTNGLVFLLITFAPFMLGLKIHNVSEYKNFIKGENFDVLDDFFSSVEGIDFFWEQLLNNDEKFDDTLNDKRKVVCLSDKIKEIYNIIFGKQSKQLYYRKNVGSISFTRDVQKAFLDAVENV